MQNLRNFFLTKKIYHLHGTILYVAVFLVKILLLKRMENCLPVNHKSEKLNDQCQTQMSVLAIVTTFIVAY